MPLDQDQALGKEGPLSWDPAPAVAPGWKPETGKTTAARAHFRERLRWGEIPTTPPSLIVSFRAIPFV